MRCRPLLWFWLSCCLFLFVCLFVFCCCCCCCCCCVVVVVAAAVVVLLLCCCCVVVVVAVVVFHDPSVALSCCECFRCGKTDPEPKCSDAATKKFKGNNFCGILNPENADSPIVMVLSVTTDPVSVLQRSLTLLPDRILSGQLACTQVTDPFT